MARRSDPEVIDLVSSSDEEDDDVVDVDGWTAVEHVAGFGAGHAAQDEDDAAMALRLQEEEYRGGPVAPPAAAAAAQAALAEPVTDLDWTRRYRSEQDAEYEASLATDRAREAQARAAATAAQAEAAAAERAAAAAKAEADAVEAAARDAAAAKTSARDRWLAAAEPPAGAAGVISVAIRFPDGSRVARRFEAGTLLLTFFEAVAAIGPLELGATFSIATGFPRRVVSKPAAGSSDTLETAGFETSASAMVVPE